MPAALTVPNPFSGFIPGRRDLYQAPVRFDRFPRSGFDPFPGRGFDRNRFDRFPHNRFDRFPRNRFNRVEPPDRFQRIPRRQQLGDFIGGGYWPYFTDPNEIYPDDYQFFEPDLMEPPPGSLSLLTTPPSAQVFVDGFYAGLAEEFGYSGRPMTVPAGPHRVELRAAGYETLSFNVMVEPNGIVRYRGDMQRLQPGAPAVAAAPVAAPAAAPAQPRVAKSYYVIPKCYAGDRPPRGPLPAGCDRRNMQTIR